MKLFGIECGAHNMIRRNIVLLLFLGCLCERFTFSYGQQGPVETDDISITGLNMTSDTEGVAYVGSVLTCSASCDPPADNFTWTVLNTNEDFNSNLVTLTDEGVYSYRCTAYNTYLGDQYNASKTVRAWVLAEPVTCTSADIVITGVNMTSGTSGVGRVGDILKCSTSCSPAPLGFKWRRLNDNQEFDSDTVVLDTEGVFSYRCSALFGVYEVSLNVRIEVLTALVPTCTTENIIISGIELTSTTKGVGRINDRMTCSTNCFPSLIGFRWRVVGTSEVIDEHTILLASPGEFTFQCSAIFGVYEISRTIDVTVSGEPAVTTVRPNDGLTAGAGRMTGQAAICVIIYFMISYQLN